MKYLIYIILSINISYATHQDRFIKEGYKWIKWAECGKCKPVCHFDAHDRGGFTCIGFTLKNNMDFYKYYIDLTYGHYSIDRYSSRYRFLPIPVRRYDAHDKKLPPFIFASYYWKKYAKPFKDCSFTALMHLTDTYILSGKYSAIKIHQRASGLTVDGKWGKKSLEACQKGKFKVDKYVKERIKFLKSLTQCKRYCTGWIKRVKQLTKKYK